MKQILAISGSTRKASSNLNLIKAFAALSTEIFEIKIFDGLTELPHFNPDLDNETPPALVKEFRNRLKAADGILICTPEYAMGVPGSLKNAIDWTVSSMEFSHKPTALITASSQGFNGHASLLQTLKIIEADINNDTQLLISFVKTKINAQNVITDLQTELELQNLISAFNLSLELQKSQKE